MADRLDRDDSVIGLDLNDLCDRPTRDTDPTRVSFLYHLEEALKFLVPLAYSFRCVWASIVGSVRRQVRAVEARVGPTVKKRQNIFGKQHLFAGKCNVTATVPANGPQGGETDGQAVLDTDRHAR